MRADQEIKQSVMISVAGGLAQLPGVRHGADAAVLLLHGVDHVEEMFSSSLFVSQSQQSLDHILEGERGDEARGGGNLM